MLLPWDVCKSLKKWIQELKSPTPSLPSSWESPQHLAVQTSRVHTLNGYGLLVSQI